MVVLSWGSLAVVRRRGISDSRGSGTRDLDWELFAKHCKSRIGEVLDLCGLALILLQAAGVRRPIHAEHAAGLPLAIGVGVLYSTTTISGPPLALMFNNQGLRKEEFRAALGHFKGGGDGADCSGVWLPYERSGF